jgi:hypothetical protein
MRVIQMILNGLVLIGVDSMFLVDGIYIFTKQSVYWYGALHNSLIFAIALSHHDRIWVFLSGTLVQLDGVEFEESVLEIIGVVRNPAITVSAGLSSTLRVPIAGTASPAAAEGDVDDLMLHQSQIIKQVHLKDLQYGTG